MAHTPQEFGPWTTVDEINKGGQGTAYKAVRAGSHRFKDFVHALNGLTGAIDSGSLFAKGYIIADILRNASEIRALKVLHQVGDDEAGKKAKTRMSNEITGMEKLLHPHLLRLIDYDKEGLKWYVTEYQPNGTLKQAKPGYTGKPLKALRDLRGVVEGVALIHESGAVHRDIKPENIFLNASNALVLGDFGLIFFENQGTRLSETLENVGSRDWMPIWAQSMRLEEVRPSFDIYTIGKTLYSMVSQRPHLRAWYHKDPEFDLEQMFPDDVGIAWIKHILDKSVGERENQIMYMDAGEMLLDFERAIGELAKGSMNGPDSMRRTCMACGLGLYDHIGQISKTVLPKNEKRPNLGMFTCDRCGHTTFFGLNDDLTVSWKMPPNKSVTDQIIERKRLKGGRK